MAGDVKVPAAATSPWAPFRYRAFTVLWLATVASFIGTWMHDVGAGWLMTSLSSSPLTVALVQTATALPIFFMALPAGALADIVDRRKLLITVQSIMMLLAGTLALLVWLEQVTPGVLLLITFLMGVCTAFNGPAWQSIVPKLIPPDTLQAAVAMNSMAVNISRAIGPALAGFIIVGVGLAAPFALNALSFLFTIGALTWWRPPASIKPGLPAEQLLTAIRSGVRYARNSEPLRATLWRALGFFFPASALWALLPLIARTELGGDASVYGGMLASIGAGAVAGAFVVPQLKERFGPDGTVAAGSGLIALVMVSHAFIPSAEFALASSFLFGGGWITVLSMLNVSAQMAVPDWMRARGLSMYLMTFFGAMSAGSALWGQVAALTAVPVALALAAVCMVASIPLTWKWKLQLGASVDLAPSSHWPAPVLASEIEDNRRPVMTTVEYRIAPQDVPEFLQKIQQLKAVRRRLGAYDWGILEDTAEPGRFVEYFLDSSWLDHLRHHERVSGHDKIIQMEVRALHRGATPPKITHLVGPKPPYRL
jgi:MFS family permease